MRTLNISARGLEVLRSASLGAKTSSVFGVDFVQGGPDRQRQDFFVLADQRLANQSHQSHLAATNDTRSVDTQVNVRTQTKSYFMHVFDPSSAPCADLD